MPKRQYDQYILIMRHAKWPVPVLGDEELRTVTDSLVNTIREFQETSYEIVIDSVVYGDSPREFAAKKTAETIYRSLLSTSGVVAPEPPRPLDQLCDVGPYPDVNTRNNMRKISEYLEGRSYHPCIHREQNGNAVLIVGHQPQVGWLAEDLAGWAVPFANAEIACFVRVTHTPIERIWRKLRRILFRRQDRGWNLWWTLAPDQTTVIMDLRDKIKSKMDVTKVLAGFVTGGVTFVLGAILDQRAEYWSDVTRWFLGGAVAALIVAVWAFFATLHAYDGLLMPSRFWEGNLEPVPIDSRRRETRSHPCLIWRPPGSAAWVLYQNMTRVWSLMFIPGVCSLILGLYLLAVAVVSIQGQAIIPAGTGLVIALALLGATIRLQPRMGSQD